MSSKKIIPVIQLDFLITGSRAFIIATTVVIRHWITNSTFRKPEKKESICLLDYWQIADSSWGHQIGLSRLIDKCINQKIWQLHTALYSGEFYWYLHPCRFYWYLHPSRFSLSLYLIFDRSFFLFRLVILLHFINFAKMVLFWLILLL